VPFLEHDLRLRVIALLLLLMASAAFGVTRTSPSHKHLRSARLRSRARSRRAVRLARLRAMILASPIHGTPESLLRQNEGVDRDNLVRIQDDDQLLDLIEAEELVRLPETPELAVAQNLPAERRYCRLWTKTFAEDLAALHYEEFHTPVQINSAVRTVAVQHKLRRHNHNAASETGERASPHLTGASLDINKRGMSKKERRWMQQYLLDLQNRGLIDAEEEFRQPVFHITVYRDYMDPTLQGAQQQQAEEKNDQ
jgi:hypothetical protein